MKRILYLLRQPMATIDEALFDSSQPDMDIVLLAHESGLSATSAVKGQVFSMYKSDHHSQISFDDLVEKIFECESTIVI